MLDGADMNLPDYQSCMLPLLEYARDGAVHRLKDATGALAARFGLSAQQRGERLPSGRQPVFSNRVGWAKTYLTKAGLLHAPGRGRLQITARGMAVLAEQPDVINTRYLDRYSEFQAFRNPLGNDGQTGERLPPPATDAMQSQTPHEALESAHERLRAELADDILRALGSTDSARFEQIVVDLLVAMGYGGSLKDAGQAIGRSGEEGIDGIIKEDHLGLDSIYVQAKRWQATVGRPEIQQFAGALQGQRARKGVFITTSDFSREAVAYTQRIESKIVLVDGRALARLMIDYGVGVSSVAVYDVKRIDSDYFADES